MSKNIYDNEQFVENDEIDIRSFFHLLAEYKRSILFITFISVAITAYIVYFKPSIYSADTLLKITAGRQGYYEDFLMVAPVGQNSEVEDKLIEFKTRPIAKKVLNKLNLGTRYYTEEYLREIELYKKSPFVVTYSDLQPQMYAHPFFIIPVDSEHFRLKLDSQQTLWQRMLSFLGFVSSDDPQSIVSYDKVHKYDELIDMPWGSLKIHRIAAMNSEKYWFTIVPNEQMTGFIQNGIETSTMTKFGSVVSLRFYDTVPQRAADIVNEVAESYIEQNVDIKSKSERKQLYFIDMQLKAITKALKDSSDKLEAYKANHTVVNLSDKARLIANQLSKYESDLYKLDMQLEIAQNMLEYMRTKQDLTDLSLDYVPQNSVVIKSLLEKLQKAMAAYVSLSARYTDNYPKVKSRKKEVIFLREALMNALETHVETLQQRKLSIVDAIAELKTKLQGVPKQEQKLEELSRHFMVNEKIYSYLLKKRAETEILASSTISNTRILQKALPPVVPVKPKRELILLIGLVIGMLLGIIQAFVRDMLDNTIKRESEIEALTDIPLYGILPLVRTKEQLPACMESIRSLWVNLAFLTSKKRAKVITVTSNISGEGKTFLTYHLSRMIAEGSKHRIIVLDMDMRRPTLHKAFGMENRKAGMSTVLNGSYSIEEAIVHTSIENLDIVFSGPKAPNPTRLIMSDTFDRVLEELHEMYDYILIDTPPIGIVSDAMKIMRYSDLVLFMLKAEYSKKDFIRMINKLNTQEEMNLGLVFNGVDYEKKYYYGYERDYYMNEYYQDTRRS